MAVTTRKSHLRKTKRGATVVRSHLLSYKGKTVLRKEKRTKTLAKYSPKKGVILQGRVATDG